MVASALLGCQAALDRRQPGHEGVEALLAPLENSSASSTPQGRDHVVVQAVALQLVGDPGQLGDQRVHRPGPSGHPLPVGPLSAGRAAVGRIAAGVAEQLTAGPRSVSRSWK